MEKRKLLTMLACLALATLLLASCAPAAAPAAAPAVAPTTAPPAKLATPTPSPKTAAEPAAGGRYGGMLTVSVGADPPSLDLHQEISIAPWSL